MEAATHSHSLAALYKEGR